MTFSKLITSLSREYDFEIFSQKFHIPIRDLALIDDRQTAFSMDVLYFGYEQQLLDRSSIPAQCILAHSENTGPGSAQHLPGGSSADFSNDIGNMAFISDSALFSVFNACRTLIETTLNNGLFEELRALADETHSIDSVLDFASIKLGQSLIFCDTTFKIISSSTSIPIVDELWIENIRQGYCNYDFIQEVKALSSVQNVVETTTAAVEVTCTRSPYRKLSCKVFLNDTQIGFILLIEGAHIASPSALGDMLRTVCDAVAYTIAHYVPDLSEVITVHQQLLYDLLIGAPSEEILPRLTQIRFPPYNVVLFLSSDLYPRGWHKKKEVADRLIRNIPGTYVTFHRHGIVAIVPLKRTTLISDKLLSALQDFAQKEQIHIGISNTLSDIKYFVPYYEQAHQALVLGKKYRAGEDVYLYIDFQDFDLFSQIQSPDSLMRFVHPALYTLKEYDAENHTALYQTLQTYLKCNCSLKDTAASLFIHRNSLSYRMNRILELCQIDLEDTHTKFLLQMSFLIQEYRTA
ncbi:PucR family transcriptional regulator [Hespellia stercorisuis]|uniref:PucR C-terminal helix-turn-helix domain-containing protein n=1 Tax=Hespellia stercorisuis DSM 15480 TaxID=1121950 RepID=A0A1M6I1Q0_9FIRM|nr:helix-turn-helix domain-containing protein [Hespellia stercorisuis]SHJ28393.1 PucR C-terminal helix-turn-helix domain-containing protein [Hespellia stercorisuis DSM 15480]